MKITITRKGSAPINQGPEQYFTGDVTVQRLHAKQGESRLSAGLVTFSPKARTAWHAHPFGQLLIITEGKGWVQQWGEAVQKIVAGDVIWFPAGIKHWHGAAPDSFMSHYALQEEKDGSAADWMEKVPDQDYPSE